ncbi:MAG: alpha/beta fold hydrolase [Deltaproteobacteria bacterium]|nr:alpha/beta fold hydrolase [Deltaproteobacteria bacterium]
MDTIINGRKLFVQESGDPQGLPVVFLHGFPFSHAMWRPQLEALPAGLRAVAYDLQGLGASDPGDGQYTLEGHVDDLIGLLDWLSIAKVAVVGLSMGGYIALRALERNPERFLAAALCDTRSEADADEAKLRRAAQVKEVKEKGSAHFAEGFLKAVFAPESFELRPEAVALIRGIVAATTPRGIAGTLIALAARSDTTASLEKIRVPVLILVGEKDQTTPPDAARAMHKKIRGSRLEIIPGAAHLSNLENPEAFNHRLFEFLGSVPRP